MSDELKNIIEGLNSRLDKYFMEGASISSIADFEKNNRIILPSKLKEWLLYSDGGEFYLPGSFQLYGVAHRPKINVNDGDRPNEKYVVIGALSSGDPVLFKIGTEEISIYNHEAGKIEDDEIYDDFTSFLGDLKNILGIEE